MAEQKQRIVSKLVHAENNSSGNSLSDIILGGQDGLVNVLGVILGVAAASSSIRIVLAGGLAAAFAESISMAAVAYTSNVAARDFYYGQLKKEKREIVEVPEIETEEIRQIYREKGFKGKLLEDVVKVITSNEKVWLDTMMLEELKLSPVEVSRPLGAALIVGLSAITGSLIPLAPFFFLTIQQGIYVSITISALTLFVLGAIKAKFTVGNWGKSGLEIAVIGIVSALAGYGIGFLFT
ncbi:MAG: VIT1/CCC1 transporter family protein [Candidatus Gracilibacteria bacterium]|jgi:predicted membrane protein (TIGR00267 family)